MATTEKRETEIIDLRYPYVQLTEWESSDTIHRAGYPRSAIGAKFGDDVVGVVTGWACDIADARCGVKPDLPSGPHPGRNTLRWYRHYIGHLDDCADLMVPDWRDESHSRGPYPWCDIAFGPVGRHGRRFPAPSSENTPGYDRDPNKPRVVGDWPFDMPPSQLRR
jgi:hypothetical protein